MESLAMTASEEREKSVAELAAEIEILKEELKRMKERAEKAEALAVRDPLTGLFNRRGLEEMFKRTIPEGRREGAPERRAEETRRDVAVLMLDLDGLKELNAELGHPTVDTIFEQIGAKLQSMFRPGDTVARVGGDEFAVILKGTDGRVINKFYDRDADPPRPRLEFPVEIETPEGKKEIRVSFSGGIAVLEPGEGAGDLTAILNRADHAAYQAKEAGKDRIMPYQKESDGS